MGRYLDMDILHGFDSYKYNSMDTSPFSNYVMHPFWNQVVKLVPKCIAANTLTFVGFMLLPLSFCILAWYDLDFTRNFAIPEWVWLMCAFNNFWSHTLVVDQRTKHRLSQQKNIESMDDGSRQNMLAKKIRAEVARLSSMGEDSKQDMLARKRRAEVARLSSMGEDSKQDMLARKRRAEVARLSSMGEDSKQDMLARKRRAASARLSSMDEDARQNMLAKKRRAEVARLSSMDEDARQNMLAKKRCADLTRLASMDDISRQDRLSQKRKHDREIRANINANAGPLKGTQRRTNRQAQAARLQIDMRCVARRYDPNKFFSVVQFGDMNQMCNHCGALRFLKEPAGICCNGGKVKLDPLPPLPVFMHRLYSGDHDCSSDFLRNIRIYNSAFQMTSFGAGELINDGWDPNFRIRGQVYHRIGSLQPEKGQQPKYRQIYFIDDQDEQLYMRQNYFRILKRNTLERLQVLLHESNAFIRDFKVAKELIELNEFKAVISETHKPQAEHPGRFNAPACSEIAILMPEDISNPRDIILRHKDGQLERIPESNYAYDPLQYPLLFPFGSSGWHRDIHLWDPSHERLSTKRCSPMAYYCYRIMIRQDFNPLLYAKRLYQQFLVDQYCKIESERLLYIKYHQKELRAESYGILCDAIANDQAATAIGKRVILPPTFTGGPRYMHARQQDAMTYVRQYGRPDFFITFTTNPKWEDLQRCLADGQNASDRPDITTRVFKLHNDALIRIITKDHVLGHTICWLNTIEFQKRGLPHSHSLIWLAPTDQVTGDDIDSIVCAEIPDPDKDPDLYEIVTSHMIHGPCGALNPRAPCMKDGWCTKGYPKPLRQHTSIENNGYPLYRRRSPEDGGRTFQIHKRGEVMDIDNRWVVPYNSYLSRVFKSHLNVELCLSIKSIKYVLKYVHKGNDQATFALTNSQDELTNYQNARYVGSSEAAWRILDLPIHVRFPSVMALSVHLPSQQTVYFHEQSTAARVDNAAKTTLTAFMDLCKTDVFAQSLLYVNVPQFYTWDNSKKTWQRRKRGAIVEGQFGVYKGDQIGRVYTVSPSAGEQFYLRMLLQVVHGPRSFEDLRRVNQVCCATYREACFTRGMIEDDAIWRACLAEASATITAKRLRNLFAILLCYCEIGSPANLWLTHRNDMVEDFLHQEQINRRDVLFDDRIYGLALADLEEEVLRMGGKSITSYGLPAPPAHPNERPREVRKELDYAPLEQANYVEERLHMLSQDQQQVYAAISSRVDNNIGGAIFIDAPGGTGKTFLLNMLLAKVRSAGLIALATASSGIAATLLTGGRTAHSVFKIPIDLMSSDVPTCNVTRNSSTATLLRQAQLIVWDEASMIHRLAFEAFDRTLRDVLGVDEPFGGKLIILCGDFRQILPVVPLGTRADTVNATLKQSVLWSHVCVFHLTTNMRVRLHGDEQAAEFSAWLLKCGEGKLPSSPDSTNSFSVEVPRGTCHIVANETELRVHVFGEIADRFMDRQWLSERAILTPLNESCRNVNNTLINEMPGNIRTFTSIDSVADEQDVNFPMEFLNSLEMSGMPPHILQLKVGCPVIILRSLDAPKIVNGTRCVVHQMMRNVIECCISTGPFAGELIAIPRIPVLSSATTIPFTLRRLQFPVALCFAMTINKSQGQTFRSVGLHLTTPAFSHGQLYVGMSRVSKHSQLAILCNNGKTQNVVFQEVL